MQMRSWLLRVFRVAIIALAAFLAFRMLEPDGLGWVVLVIAGVGSLAWIAWRFMRVRKLRREDADADRWAEALMDPPLRPSAIRELRAALTEVDPSRKKDAPRHARLTLVLAELLEADGEPTDALEALRAVKDEALPERSATMVRHARAVASLSAGDVEGASKMLDELGGVSGDRGLELRVRALRGLVLAEMGVGERALELAEEVRVEAGSDPDLRIEARVLKAVALDVLGERSDAVKVMRALGEEMLGVLLVLGLPRVKKLADLALDDD
jgi:hypothetical protein